MLWQLAGVRGGGSCATFSHFDTAGNDLAGYKVSVWGKQDIRPDRVCPTALSELNHTLEFYPPLRDGTWIFLVFQPDGSVLRKEAVVR